MVGVRSGLLGQELVGDLEALLERGIKIVPIVGVDHLVDGIEGLLSARRLVGEFVRHTCNDLHIVKELPRCMVRNRKLN